MGILDNIQSKLENFPQQVSEKVQTTVDNFTQKASDNKTKDSLTEQSDIKRESKYCQNCGTKLNDDARFCHSCGSSVVNHNEEVQEKRKNVFDGEIHKCPNCGETLESFITNCPSCGYEIRNLRSSSSVQELAAKLEEIDLRQMPQNTTRSSIMKKIIGVDFNKGKEEDLRREFEFHKREQKANLVINFPVPNTKEDIIEFMLLVSSNIEAENFYNDIIKAWISKFEQVYKRANIIIDNQEDMAQIKTVYEDTKKMIRKKRIKNILLID